MAYAQQINQEQEALNKNNNLVEIDLSLEVKVILAYKNHAANRHKLLMQLTRANAVLDNKLNDKTRFLHIKACYIADIILVSLVRKGVTATFLTSKGLIEITDRSERQNRNILKQLGNLFEFHYQRKYLEYNHCYIFKINPKVREILENSEVNTGGAL